MIYDKKDINNAIKYLNEKYPDTTVNNNKYIVSNDGITITENYKFLSMKQSVFQHVCYKDCVFENVALTGSIFDFVKFIDTALIGSSFANCEFYMVDIDGKDKIMESNNFSQSNFEMCHLYSVEMFKSGVLNSLFHNCKLKSAYFRGSTFEGTKFINCVFVDCDFGKVNLDYTMFAKNTYENIVFPFYQVAYIIGSADFINNNGGKISLKVGTGEINIMEYREQIDRLILFYLDKNEYFPICNLCIAQKKYDEARSYLFDGITKALMTRNFRMISNFCQLARYHGLINDKLRYKITKAMDEFIQADYIPESQLNYYLIYIGRIKTFINEGSGDTITLNYSIKTNSCKKNEEGVNYVNELVKKLNLNLSNLENVEGFEVSTSNHSPFEIAVGVITIISSVATVAQTVMDIISGVQVKSKANKTDDLKNETSDNSQLVCEFIDERIERAKYEIKDLQNRYRGKKLNKYIDEVTQSLKTDMEDLYSKEIMFFKINNKNIK